MADVVDKHTRSKLMSGIRGRGNAATELRLAGLLRTHGIAGWRRRQRVLGHPDFTFRTARLVIFVDGCFWHGCPRHYVAPKSNRTFWMRKRRTNRARDCAVVRDLQRLGWTIIRIWECELREMPRASVAKILRAIEASPRKSVTVSGSDGGRNYGSTAALH